MEVVIKILLILACAVLFVLPLLPLPIKARRFSTFYALRYRMPYHRRNLSFVLLTAAECAVVLILFNLIYRFVTFLNGLPFVQNITSAVASRVGAHAGYVLFVVEVLVLNLLVLYGSTVLKAFFKKLIFDPLFGWDGHKKLTRSELQEMLRRRKAEKRAKKLEKKRKKQKCAEEPKDGSEEKKEPEANADEDLPHIPRFVHGGEAISEEGSEDGEDRGDAEKEKHPEEEEEEERCIPKTRFGRWFWGLFFDTPEYCYAKPEVARVVHVLQIFLWVAEAFYLLLFLLLAASVLFPLPDVVYHLLYNVFGIRNLYVYPLFSLLLLQEICNTLKGAERKVQSPELIREKKKKVAEKVFDIRLQALNGELKRRFDDEHRFRHYPEVRKKDVEPYVSTSKQYASALNYISEHMEKVTGHVVQSYLESFDAAFNDHHVYFGTSFYSEYGEYLMAYTYTRLLSGARMIFIVSDESQRDPLRRYIRDQLTSLTECCRDEATWRVYVTGERLDQADVLVACPEDFKDDGIVDHYPAFFEEVCNAVFVDAGRAVSISSYLCPILSMRLMEATDKQIRYIFLSQEFLHGFAAKSLPRFFSIDQVFTCSNALENEETSYTLFNRESRNHRIYNKHGQVLTSMECIIAELALRHKIDGVKVITNTPIEHADRAFLTMHNVEINRFKKGIPDINYLIYSDERCNLAAAIYCCTRFRGAHKSVATIISKPYLLRDYFTHMAQDGKYINTSSFIQPRVTEHVSEHKLSLLRVFCEATTDTALTKGMTVRDFIDRMSKIFQMVESRHITDMPPYCAGLLAKWKKSGADFTEKEYAEYLIAGLLDDKDTPAGSSAACNAKDYYLVYDLRLMPYRKFSREKRIEFKQTRKFFDRLLLSNERVELRLNDERVGYLDTFPARVSQQYMVGQNLIYDNVEYEIENISPDHKTIYLRCENGSFRNLLDTVFLRRYSVSDLKPIGLESVMHRTSSPLFEIRVGYAQAHVVGESYGFYSLTADRQTLDFYQGVEGNPRLAAERLPENRRDLDPGRLLTVTLRTKMKCTDGMRLLVSAVLNEFVKTVLPDSYRSVAICPILMEPYVAKELAEDESIEDKIVTLYPYLTGSDCPAETDETQMRFYLINDCEEDVGALEWFYDGRGQYMLEFLAHVHSYLHWLSVCGKAGTYIYFGGEKLPVCFDLDGCCELFADLNLRLSEGGEKDIETAGDVTVVQDPHRCAFCHRLVESGRYELFDRHRYICMDCFDVVKDDQQLKQILENVHAYLLRTYPALSFGDVEIRSDKLYEREENEVFSEYYYRLDREARVIYVEKDLPVVNAAVAALRGLIELWQIDNGLQLPSSDAQLYYEELLYLRAEGKEESADWIRENLKPEILSVISSIDDYVQGRDLFGEETPEDGETSGDEATSEDGDTGDGENVPEDGAETSPVSGRNSFLFLREEAKRISQDLGDDETADDDDYSNELYDPNDTPRFWKRYLRGHTASEGVDELSMDEEDPQNASLRGELRYGKIDVPNAPSPEGDEPDPGETDGEMPEDPVTDPDETEIPEDDSEEIPEDDSEEIPEDDSEEIPEDDSEEIPEDDSEEIPEDDAGETPGDDTGADPEEDPGEKRQKEPKDKKEKKAKKEKKDKKDRDRGKGSAPKKSKKKKGEISDEDEATNPKVRLYNEILRHAMAYDTEMFSRCGISDDQEIKRIFTYALGDNPEVFWVQTFSYTATEMGLVYRCLNEDGKVDVAQINRKRKALKKGAKTFTRGISRKTKPYDALLTIYRRLILTLDYDSLGLNKGVDKDTHSDDTLRSLYSALVEHKVVCAGYAVAMQYLLQSVGISCAYVISEADASGSLHAFNALKIGRFCYYLDATWGDYSNTLHGSAEEKNRVRYDYCCTPLREFRRTSEESVPLHTPSREKYPDLEEFKATHHEYFRYHKAYFDRYDENAIVKLMAETAKNYDKREMGDFQIAFRAADPKTRDYIVAKLSTENKLFDLMKKAAESVPKKKRYLLEAESCMHCFGGSGTTVYYFPKLDDRKK